MYDMGKVAMKDFFIDASEAVTQFVVKDSSIIQSPTRRQLMMTDAFETTGIDSNFNATELSEQMKNDKDSFDPKSPFTPGAD